MVQDINLGESFYYADGEKIPLKASNHFVAVRATSEEVEREVGAARIADSLATVATPAQVFQLPEYHLTVVKVADTNGMRMAGATSGVATVRSFVDAQPELTLAPSVYETAEANSEVGLIPIGEIIVKFRPDVAEADKHQLLGVNELEVKQADYPEPGAYLVRTNRDYRTIEIANELHENNLVEYAQPNFVRLAPRIAAPEGAAQVMVPPDRMPSGNGNPLASAPTLLESPQAIPIPMPAPAAPPSDPGYASQWGLRKINAPEAFNISMGSPAISIAIIDEGCDLGHEDLRYKLPGYDAYSNDDNPTPQPRDGHGTSCAGVAAAIANNGKGGAGVAPQCKILPIRIARGISGGYWDTSDAIAAKGIRTAVDRGADVLSNSYTLWPPSTVVTNAFRYAQTNGRGGRGCPIAAASGNGDARGVTYPARLSPTIPGLMAVGATNEWDQRKSKTSLDGETWWGSNYGPELDIVAPGVHIYTTDITGSAGYGGGNYISNFNGTSSATPHVAGLMALILSVDPDLRSWEVEDIIKLTAKDLGTTGRDEQFGFGRIDCHRAVEAALRLWYEIEVKPEFLGDGQECYMRIKLRMYNPGINSVRLDALTLTSHSPDWSAEIDRFEYRPNPGGVMAPRSDDDVRFNGILLKANGNRRSWSYRWSMSWSYTFWRPSTPGFPLAANMPLEASEGRTAQGQPERGGAEGGSPELTEVPPTLGNGSLALVGDAIAVDRQTKTITITIR